MCRSISLRLATPAPDLLLSSNGKTCTSRSCRSLRREQARHGKSTRADGRTSALQGRTGGKLRGLPPPEAAHLRGAGRFRGNARGLILLARRAKLLHLRRELRHLPAANGGVRRTETARRDTVNATPRACEVLRSTMSRRECEERSLERPRTSSTLLTASSMSSSLLVASSPS